MSRYPVLAAVAGLSNDDVKTIGAAATTVGVLIALFAPPLRAWWRRPILTVDYDGVRSDPYWDRISPTPDAFFLRVRVRNARNCDTATDVQVLVSSYRAADLGLEGRALEWSGQRAWSDPPITRLDIPPGLQRHADVLQIGPAEPAQAGPDMPPATDGDTEAPLARLCVFPKPAGSAHLIPEGDHHVTVVVTATNANPVGYRFTIVYDGEMSARLSGPPKRTRRRSVPDAMQSGMKWAFRGFRTPDA